MSFGLPVFYCPLIGSSRAIRAAYLIAEPLSGLIYSQERWSGLGPGRFGLAELITFLSARLNKIKEDTTASSSAYSGCRI